MLQNENYINEGAELLGRTVRVRALLSGAKIVDVCNDICVCGRSRRGWHQTFELRIILNAEMDVAILTECSQLTHLE